MKHFTCCKSGFVWKPQVARSALISLFIHTVRDISILRKYFIPLTICDLKEKKEQKEKGSMDSMLLIVVHFTHEEVDFRSHLSLCFINGRSLKKEGIIGHVVEGVGCS